MPLFLNTSMADLFSFSDSLISTFMSICSAFIVLSSKDFSGLASVINKNRLIMKSLNKIEPNMELWVATNKTIFKKISVSFILHLLFTF